MELSREAVLGDFGIVGEDVPHLITFVGKLTHFKGIDVLIRALPACEQALPGLMTLIIGFGELNDSLRDLCGKVGAENVHFLGHQPQQDVARLYNVADLSVVPSRVEPFGLVAVEALATNTPVVATNAGGLPDFINEDVGALVPMDNPGKLGAAIIREITTDAKGKKGPGAGEYARAKLSWAVQVKKMEALYQEVLGR
jgi:glycosyltransferase involved in cell wall biosynthesis